MPAVPSPVEFAEGFLFAERYRIAGLLGRGGMGAVYRAQDLLLGETVALKILLTDVAAYPELATRFRQEVKLSRRISHPNVVRVHDIGESDGLLCMTMEVVDGQTLRDRLRAERRLPTILAVEIGKAIANALSAAHAVEIIHRDLKPSNVLIEHNGRVVLTDFGIARCIADEQHLTNGAIGTMHYMAPEQATNGRVDARSDIYSLGVVLYEMLVGERPAGSSAEIALRIDKERATIPPALATLVLRCLSLSPDSRPDSAASLSSKLAAAIAEPDEDETVAPSRRRGPRSFVPVAPAEQKLAVLPFRYRGPKDQEYLSDVLTDELVDTISRTKGLRVLGSGATTRFRDTRDPIAIGRELFVHAVIDGAVQTIGDRLRVSVRLIEAATGVQHWAQQHDGSLADLFTFQESIARRVAEGLRCELHTMVHSSTAPTEAIDRYLEARKEMRLADGLGTRRAVELLDGALAIAPMFGPAISAHAVASVRAWFIDSEVGRHELDEKAAESVARATESAPDIAESHIALAAYETQLGHYREAMSALFRAIEIAPTCASAHEQLGMLLFEAGNLEKGLYHLEFCSEVDPSRAVCWVALTRLYAFLGRREAAMTSLAKVIPLERPDRFPPSVMFIIRDAAFRADHDAIRLCLAEHPNLTMHGLGMFMTAYAKVVLGELSPAFVEQTFAPSLDSSKSPRFLSLAHQLIAEMYASRGDHDAALGHIKKAADLAMIEVTWLERCPLLAPLRDTLPFQEITRLVRERAAVIRA